MDPTDRPGTVVRNIARSRGDEGRYFSSLRELRIVVRGTSVTPRATRRLVRVFGSAAIFSWKQGACQQPPASLLVFEPDKA